MQLTGSIRLISQRPTSPASTPTHQPLPVTLPAPLLAKSASMISSLSLRLEVCVLQASISGVAESICWRYFEATCWFLDLCVSRPG
jgi:hypothetical protein